MGLTCNIGTRGRAVRMAYGIVALLAGLGLVWFWALPGGTPGRWVVAILVCLAGGFCVFEARAGWCVIRAMGLKTPM